MTLKSADARRPTLKQDAEESGERNKRDVATCFEARRTRIGAAWRAASNGGAQVSAQLAGLSRRRVHLRKRTRLCVVDRRAEDEDLAHPARAAVGRPVQQTHGLEPPLRISSARLRLHRPTTPSVGARRADRSRSNTSTCSGPRAA